jgi:hypothetical protein
MLPYGSESDESLGNYSWVFNELTDEADSKGDPNYTLPEPARRRYTNALPEEVGENSITTSISRKYNLRPRSRH